MTTVQTTEMRETLSQNDADEMTKYGIKQVSIKYFYLGEYGYQDLKDAVAQAKRELNTAVKKKC
jgi:hypothetical protein